MYIDGMRITFDPAKAAVNLKKHGVSFADAAGVLEDPLAITIEDPDARGEQRLISIGLGNAAELLVVVYTERNDGCRLISARPATKRERQQYEN
jgi:uncharacterized DUF497 family protein